MRRDQIDAGDPRLREQLGHPRGDLAGATPEVEHVARGVPLHDRQLLRPDRLGLSGEVPDHRLVRHLLGLRASIDFPA
jgi:hypothetical protein